MTLDIIFQKVFEAIKLTKANGHHNLTEWSYDSGRTAYYSQCYQCDKVVGIMVSNKKLFGDLLSYQCGEEE